MFPQIVQDGASFFMTAVVIVLASVVVYKVGMAVIHRVFSGDPEENNR